MTFLSLFDLSCVWALSSLPCLQSALAALLCSLGFTLPTLLLQLPGARRGCCIPVPKHFIFLTVVSNAFVLLTCQTSDLNVFFKADLSQYSCAVSEHFRFFLHSISKRWFSIHQATSLPRVLSLSSLNALHWSCVCLESCWEDWFSSPSVWVWDLLLYCANLLHVPCGSVLSHTSRFRLRLTLACCCCSVLKPQPLCPFSVHSVVIGVQVRIVCWDFCGCWVVVFWTVKILASPSIHLNGIMGRASSARS